MKNITHPISHTAVRRSLLLGALCAGALAAQAQFLFEGFDYPDAAGTHLTNVTASPWVGTAGQTSVLLQDGNLTGGGLTDPVLTHDKRARLTAVNSIHYRTFNDSAIGSGSVYVSFLMQVTTMQTTDNYVSALVCLDNDGGVSTSSGTGSRQARAGLVVYYQRLTATTYRIGVRKNEGSASNGTTAWGTATFAPNQVVLVVAKYTFNPGSGDDTVTLWLNPTTLGGTEDPSPAVAASTTSNTSDSQPLRYVVLVNGSAGNGGGVVELDSIRVGDSWSSVTPSGPLIGQQLGFTVQPFLAGEGQTMRPIEVQVQNASGLPVASNNVPITLTLTSGSGTLSGTVTRNTDAAGRAVFTNLSINLPGQKQLTASASGIGAGLTNAVSIPFWIIKNPDAAPGAGAPVITQAVAAAGSFILRGQNGAPGGEYRILSSTNVTQPMNLWASVFTNNFDGAGAFAWTNPLVPGGPRFFRVQGAGGGGGGGQWSHVGYAAVPAPITGGGNTTNIIWATNLASFIVALSNSQPAIIYIDGTITLRTNGNTYFGPNKTLIGLGTNATLIGNLGIFLTEGSATYNATNIIIRNLTLTNPNGYGEDDCITLKNGGKQVWIDHCTFHSALDGLVDATREADFLTVSWCKFYYTAPNGHENVHLIGGSDSDTADAGKLHVTLHHNWYGTFARERMPSVRFGRAHVFNNYFNSPGNNYCVRTRLHAEVLVENNHFQDVQNPWELIITSGTTGKLRATGNLTNNCAFTTAYPHNTGGTLVLIDGSDTLTPGDPLGLNPPPYAYTLDPAANVANLVTNHAGAGKGPFAY